jgi:glucose/arabinose dehydrogenase
MATLRLRHAALAVLAVLLLASPSGAQTAAPSATSDPLNERLKAAAKPQAPATPIPSALLNPPKPTTAQHADYIVTTNKKGQVVTVKPGKQAADKAFDAMTMGNATQMFIRTPEGLSIAGTYRVTYDYSPETKDVKRTVAIITAGGVDPDAIGAVDRMIEIDRKNAERAKQARANAKASPAAATPIPTP